MRCKTFCFPSRYPKCEIFTAQLFFSFFFLSFWFWVWTITFFIIGVVSKCVWSSIKSCNSISQFVKIKIKLKKILVPFSCHFICIILRDSKEYIVWATSCILHKSISFELLPVFCSQVYRLSYLSHFVQRCIVWANCHISHKGISFEPLPVFRTKVYRLSYFPYLALRYIVWATSRISHKVYRLSHFPYFAHKYIVWATSRISHISISFELLPIFCTQVYRLKVSSHRLWEYRLEGNRRSISAWNKRGWRAKSWSCSLYLYTRFFFLSFPSLILIHLTSHCWIVLRPNWRSSLCTN